MTNAQRGAFDEMVAEVAHIDAQLVKIKNQKKDTRGTVLPGGKRAHDAAFTRYLRTGDDRGLTMVEQRADGTGFSTPPNDAGVAAGSTGNYAGYMVPQGFWKNLQIALKAYGGLANDFRVVNTETGNPMPWPTVDPTAVTATCLGASNELNQLSVGDPYVFGQGVLNAWTIVMNPILASLQLVRDSAFSVDKFVADRMGEAVGREIAALAVSSSGSGQPLGIIPALNAKGAWSAGSSGGYVSLTAATYVTTLGGTKTELGGNLLAPQTLLSMIQAVDPAYRALGAKFYVSDAQLAGLRTVVDGYGRPLLQDPSKQGGNPSLWGYDVVVDNGIPALTASTTGGPVFGYLESAMVMRTVQDQTTVMRLTERYADYLAVGYIGYYRMDIRSNDLRAAVTVKPAAT